jgi:DNA-binding response OmpR family regulator
MLLRYLAMNKGKLVSREELYEHVWGRDDYYNSNTIDVHIRRLRKRLKSLISDNWIKSVYGGGYKIYNFPDK